MIKKIYPFIIFCFAYLIPPLFAQEPEDKNALRKDWAIGLSIRMASIPFAAEGKNTVGGFLPLLFYEGEHFFFRGIEGGYKYALNNRWQMSALGRIHFLDIPKKYQNEIQGDNVDWGLQLRFIPLSWQHFIIEMMSDWEGNFHSNLRAKFLFKKDRFTFEPYAELKLKTKKYNSYYFGLTLEDIKGGTDITAGFIADFHLWSSLYLFGAAKITHLDRSVRNARLINDSFTSEVVFGVGLSDDRNKRRNRNLRNRPYWRVSHGWATTSALAQIIRFQSEPDSSNNQLTSIFYGHPLADELFGLPLGIYLTPGFIWHWKSSVQDHSQEVVLAIKLFYTLKWPFRWRLGAAEGLSYMNEIPYLERVDFEKNNYRPSKLLNYLDISVDINIGDFVRSDPLRQLWLGYYIHHRSGIFESQQLFGRISGGSNYNSFYLKWHL